MARYSAVNRALCQVVTHVNAVRRTELVAPLGNTEERLGPFEVTHTDITGPYPVTQRGNKYLLTFIVGFQNM